MLMESNTVAVLDHLRVPANAPDLAIIRSRPTSDLGSDNPRLKEDVGGLRPQHSIHVPGKALCDRVTIGIRNLHVAGEIVGVGINPIGGDADGVDHRRRVGDDIYPAVAAAPPPERSRRWPCR